MALVVVHILGLVCSLHWLLQQEPVEKLHQIQLEVNLRYKLDSWLVNDDKVAALYLISNATKGQPARHIDVQYHFVRN